MFNPFFIYCYAFIYILVLYGMKWSNLFPQMSYTVLIFLISTIIIMFITGVFINKKVIKRRHDLSTTEDRHIERITKILSVLHILNIVYAGNIPILQIVRNTGYLYTEGFNGLPFIQTFLLAFSAFYATYSFDTFLSTRRKKFLLLLLLNILPFVLLFYRSTLVIIVLNCTWVYLLRIKRIKFKAIIVVLISFLIGGYFFGLAGDMRTSNQFGTYDNREAIITNMGQATEEFMSTNIPKQYFWLYMYSASPLANFQHTVDVYDNIELNMKNLISFVNNQMIYDVFSTRLNNLFEITTEKTPLVSNGFTVSTIYGRSFLGIGWLGPLLIFNFMLIGSIFYVVLISRSNKFFRVGIATLNTIIFLSIFANMFVVTSLAVQLIVPFIVERSKKINFI